MFLISFLFLFSAKTCPSCSKKCWRWQKGSQPRYGERRSEDLRTRTRMMAASEARRTRWGSRDSLRQEVWERGVSGLANEPGRRDSMTRKLVALQSDGWMEAPTMNSVFCGELKTRCPNLCRFHVDVDTTKTTDEFFGIWHTFLSDVKVCLNAPMRARRKRPGSCRRSGDHSPDRRFQWWESGVQELLFHRVGRGRPGHDPPSETSLLPGSKRSVLHHG